MLRAMKRQRVMRKVSIEVVISRKSAGWAILCSSVRDHAFFSSFKGHLISFTQGQGQNAPTTL